MTLNCRLAELESAKEAQQGWNARIADEVATLGGRISAQDLSVSRLATLCSPLLKLGDRIERLESRVAELEVEAKRKVVAKPQTIAVEGTTERVLWAQTGELPLRDYFAGQSLSGFVANYADAGGLNSELRDELAVEAYDLADAMLAAREAKP